MKLFIPLMMLLCSLPVLGQNYHTEYTYTEGAYNGITIQNSYPKGGLTYTAVNGREYAYLVFYTCISNHSTTALTMNIDFSANSFIVPTAPGIDFNIFVPAAEMTLAKATEFNYGFSVEDFLDTHLGKATKLNATIPPKQTKLFYTVLLSTGRVEGVVRTGFFLEEGRLLYTVNGTHISGGALTKQ
ncbi:hypothetical protein [Neptunitalea lumnitzerae]|uniref:Uncharacterized protein n=1 Tax=Neptunitalea lumnitzerae TaxID=2965509 RepID=A0ABQ5MLM7_9FLAO|nr:hypothetical protein [Neptunitalea sp. Y10]GLB50318.1 hypothetical protein Y10_26860 [Neptunitalea sp. Y10]